MMNKKNSPIINIKNVSKSFTTHVGTFPVLKDINFEIRQGEFLIIFGPSGSGKSTLLHTITGLETPTQGSVEFFNQNIYAITEDVRAMFRVEHIGMVYQQPIWIRSMNVLKNVAFPLILQGIDHETAAQKAEAKIDWFGMLQWKNHIPTELSAGQQQKIALARALVTEPQVIIADEPTGNLDHDSGEHLIKTLQELCNSGRTVITVTHDLEYLEYADRTIYIKDGIVAGQYTKEDTAQMYRELFMHEKVAEKGAIVG